MAACAMSIMCVDHAALLHMHLEASTNRAVLLMATCTIDDGEHLVVRTVRQERGVPPVARYCLMARLAGWVRLETFHELL